MAPFRFVAVAALVVSTCGLAVLEAQVQQPATRPAWRSAAGLAGGRAAGE